MKATIHRTDLLKTLSHVQSVVERRNTIPVLSNILIDAAEGRMIVSATDLDLQVKETVQATVDRAGRTTVSAHLLYDIVRKMPDGEITIDEEAGRMLVRAGRARFSLPTLPAEDFPEIATGDMPHTFTIHSKELARIIQSVRFAMSTEETRYYLNGIFMHIRNLPEGKDLAAVATDGHRLSLMSIALPEGSENVPDVIVPKKCVAEVGKIVDTIDVPVVISVSDRKIRFDLGGLVFVSKVIDGTYPDYRRVIPSDNDKTIVVNADDLAEGIDRCSCVATEKTRAIKIGVEKGKLVLSVTSPENGTATEEVEADYAGAAMEIGFNSRYLLDILQRSPGQDVEILMKDAAAPTLLRRKGATDSLCVLMPMRV